MQTPAQIRDRQARTLMTTIQAGLTRAKNETVQICLKNGDLNLLLSLLTLYTLPAEPPVGAAPDPNPDPNRTYMEVRLARELADATTAARLARADADRLVWLDDRPAGYYTTAQTRSAARALATATAALLDANHAIHGSLNPLGEN